MTLIDEFTLLKEKTSTIRDVDIIDDTKGSDFNILILTSSVSSLNRKIETKNPTVKKIEKYCEKNGIDYFTAFADTAFTKRDEKTNKLKIYNIENENGFEIDNQKTFIIARRGVLFRKHSINLVLQLEADRFCFLNEMKAMEICEDKFLTYLKLKESDVNTPRSCLIASDEMIDYAFNKIGGEFPVIVKTLNGTQGLGVMFIDNYTTLKSALQALWSVSSSTEMMIQEYIKSKYDIRVHVINNEVVASMKRHVVKKDFRSNVHLGGDVSEYKPDDEITKIAVKASKAVKCNWSGVDIIIDKLKTPYVLEVNASPGTDGIESVTDKSIIKDVFNFIKNKDDWKRPIREIGTMEIIEIDGIGEMIARFDTGNVSESSSLDASEIEEKNGKVYWKTNNVKMSGRKIRTVRIKPNIDDDDISDERPEILLDVIFEGIKYKNVPFNLNDREKKKSQALMNTKFMANSGYVVNPAKQFVVTEKPDEDEKKLTEGIEKYLK